MTYTEPLTVWTEGPIRAVIAQTSVDLRAVVARLREQGTDDAECEVKASAQGLGKSVWDTVSAFANTSGGLLLLGLSEADAFAPADGFDPDRVRDQFVEGVAEGGGPGLITPTPAYQISRGEVEGAPVLVIDIAENALDEKPCFVRAKGMEGGSFKRVDDKDLKLSATEVFELRMAMSPQDSDRVPVPEAEEADLDLVLVDSMLAYRRGSKALQGVAERTDQLVRLNVATKAGEIRLAGLLAVGAYPQQFAPRLHIDVAVHPANVKSAPDEPVRFVDRTLCDGPLPLAIEQAVEATARNLRAYATVEGAARREHLEIPREALREAIANAVLHREYHHLFWGQAVTVDVHPDRVVVTSPGGLWGGKTAENLDDGTSRCRNQTLLQLLQSTPQAGTAGLSVEGQGGGVALMIHTMEAHALDRPRFRIAADQVSVELRRHGAEIPALRQWLRTLSEQPLSSYDDAALLIAKREGSVDVRELRDLLRIDSDDARKLLTDLTNRGLLRPDGRETYVLWSAAPPARPTESAVLEALSPSAPKSIQDLATSLGKNPNALRPVLRRLVAEGRIRATAPASSRKRAYLRLG